jgi:hypothetical protein
MDPKIGTTLGLSKLIGESKEAFAGRPSKIKQQLSPIDAHTDLRIDRNLPIVNLKR